MDQVATCEAMDIFATPRNRFKQCRLIYLPNSIGLKRDCADGFAAPLEESMCFKSATDVTVS